MPTVLEVDAWIQLNVLDSDAWDKAAKKDLAVVQATRNLSRWYPDVELTTEPVAYQAIWELHGLDPVLKYQNQGIRALTDNGERVDYVARSKVSPDVRDLLGTPLYEIEEQEAEQESPPQFGGVLL